MAKSKRKKLDNNNLPKKWEEFSAAEVPTSQILASAISAKDLHAVFEKLISEAKSGSSQSAKLIIEYYQKYLENEIQEKNKKFEVPKNIIELLDNTG